ncbi:hypothetical protein BC828DRAFT_22863, partial [Blastocladiella britannica]
KKKGHTRQLRRCSWPNTAAGHRDRQGTVWPAHWDEHHVHAGEKAANGKESFHVRWSPVATSPGSGSVPQVLSSKDNVACKEGSGVRGWPTAATWLPISMPRPSDRSGSPSASTSVVLLTATMPGLVGWSCGAVKTKEREALARLRIGCSTGPHDSRTRVSGSYTAL